jgi:hypothetical protein
MESRVSNEALNRGLREKLAVPFSDVPAAVFETDNNIGVINVIYIRRIPGIEPRPVFRLMWLKRSVVFLATYRRTGNELHGRFILLIY